MIYHGDYTDILNAMPDESIKLILTDPPFGINYKSTYGKRIKGDQSFFSYHELGSLAYRKLQPGGVLIAFTDWSTLVKHYLEVEASGLTMQPWFTFQRRNAGAGCVYECADNAERALFATKGNYETLPTQLIKNKKTWSAGRRQNSKRVENTNTCKLVWCRVPIRDSRRWNRQNIKAPPAREKRRIRRVVNTVIHGTRRDSL